MESTTRRILQQCTLYPIHRIFHFCYIDCDRLYLRQSARLHSMDNSDWEKAQDHNYSHFEYGICVSIRTISILNMSLTRMAEQVVQHWSASNISVSMLLRMNIGVRSKRQLFPKAHWLTPFLADRISDIVIWSIVECSLGIIAGSASTWKPLFRGLSTKLASSNRSTSKNRRQTEYGLRNLTAPAAKGFKTQVSSNRRDTAQDDNDSQKDMIVNQGITINRELNIDEEYELQYEESLKTHHRVYEVEV